MAAQRQTPIISWALGLLTIVVLIVNLPENLSAVLGLWLLFLVFTTFTLNAGVLLTAGEIHPTHLFSIMAFLSMAHNDQTGNAEALWAIAVGSLIGGLIQVARDDEWLPRRRVNIRSLGTVVEVMAQQTLSLLVGGAVYVTLGGRLPLGRLATTDLGPLAGLLVAYLLMVLLFFILSVRLEGRQVSQFFAANWPIMLAVLLLPGPFAILGAVVITELDPFSGVIMFVGLVLTVGGVHGLSRIQFRTRLQVEELSSLSAVSRALRTSLELDTLLNTIYLQVASLLNVDNFTAALLDPIHDDTLTFPLAYRRGQKVPLSPRRLENSLLDYVVSNSSPLLIERNVWERAQQLNLTVPKTPAYSWLGVPIIASGRLLGAIAIFSSEPERLLSPGDERLLMDVAGQAGVAIENAKLFKQAKNRVQQLATLNSISALLSGTLALDKVVNLVTSSAAAVSDCDAVALYLYENGAPVLTRNIGLTAAFSDHPPAPLIAKTIAEDAPERLSRQPVVVTNVRESGLDWNLVVQIEQEDKRAWVEWLLVTGEVPLGVIIVYYKFPRAFSNDDIELMRNFVTQAALAVNNARRYGTIDVALERRIHHLQVLFDISQEMLSILDIQPVFELMLNRVLEGTNSDSGMLVLGAAEEVSGVQVVASHGYPPGAFHDPLALAGSTTAKVYDTGLPVLLPDLTEHRDYAQLNPQTRSQLSVPIIREGQTLGVITVASDKPDRYDDDDIFFMTNLTAYAAMAIYNAQLFKRVEQGRDRLRVILDSMAEGVLLLNRDGRVEMANPRIEALVGQPQGKLENRLVDDLVQDSGSLFTYSLGFSVGGMRVLMADLRAGRVADAVLTPYSYELSEPQHQHLKRQIAPVHDEGGALLGLLLVFIDETEQQELARARDDLSRMIVHDLRSPLTAVTASLKLLNDVIPKESDFSPLVSRMTDASMRAVRKLLNLVDSLLDIAKMEAGQMVLEQEPTHLNAIAGNVVMEMDLLARELDVTLAADIDYDLPLLDVDDEKIERLLLNLVDNALKFTPSGGRVEISAIPPAEPETTGVSIIDDDDDEDDEARRFLVVQVSDTGPGVPHEYRERLFNRFVQVDGVRGRRRGTGLGLTFCRLAVKAHGGRIWVEDNPGGGAIFSMTLPIADPSSSEEDDLAVADLLLPDSDDAAPLL